MWDPNAAPPPPAPTLPVAPVGAPPTPNQPDPSQAAPLSRASPRKGLGIGIVLASVIVALGLGAGVGYGLAAIGSDTTTGRDPLLRSTTTVDELFVLLIDGDDLDDVLCDSDVADDLVDEVDDQLDAEVIDFTTYNYTIDEFDFSAYGDSNDSVSGTLTLELDDDKWCIDSIEVF